MISIPNLAQQLEELQLLHEEAIAADCSWTEIWRLFYEHPWFKHRLNASAIRQVRRCHMPLEWTEDIKQEALLVFARAIQRDCALGFDSSRGSFGGFLSTIIERSCQKGLRQFKHSINSVGEEYNHPFLDNRQELEEHIDLQDCLARLPEPYKMTIELIFKGESVPEIAQTTRRSQRTVYRWLEKATDLIRDAWLEEE